MSRDEDFYGWSDPLLERRAIRFAGYMKELDDLNAGTEISEKILQEKALYLNEASKHFLRRIYGRTTADEMSHLHGMFGRAAAKLERLKDQFNPNSKKMEMVAKCIERIKWRANPTEHELP